MLGHCVRIISSFLWQQRPLGDLGCDADAKFCAVLDTAAACSGPEPYREKETLACETSFEKNLNENFPGT